MYRFDSNDSYCDVYGKRLKLIDRFWSSSSFLNQTNSAFSFPMQKENDFSDDEDDCCIIAEIRRRKKPGNTVVMQPTPTPEPVQGAAKSHLNVPWSLFSFQKSLPEKNSQDDEITEVKNSSQLLVKNDSTKDQPKKFFRTPRTISQGNIARPRSSYKNLSRRRTFKSILQESYRLNEKYQYMQLLQSQTSAGLFFTKCPLRNCKETNKPVQIIDLCDEDSNENKKTPLRKNDQEEQDVQIVKEIPGIRSFQDALKLETVKKTVNNGNTNIASKSSHYKSTYDSLQSWKTKTSFVDVDIRKKTDVLEEEMRNIMQISSADVYEVENEDSFNLPELSFDQEEKIKKALIPEPSEEVLSSGFGLQITRHDMQTLMGLNWLNDEIINFYMNLIMDRNKLNKKLPKVYAFNTFFYPKLISSGYTSLRRWTKQVDIFLYDIVLVPIHLGMHWCMSIIDFRSKSIKYCDSIGSSNDSCLDALLLFLRAESLDKKNKIFPTLNWEKTNVEDVPQQMNGSDCGVFSCMFAEYLARDCKISFTQDDMPYFRKKMVIEILEKKLLT